MAGQEEVLQRARSLSVVHRTAAAQHLQQAAGEEYAQAEIDAELDKVQAEIADHRHEAVAAPMLHASLPLSLREQPRSDPWLGSMFTMNSLRGVVSKKKRRFVDVRLGLDLDLSFITRKVIAMGFPSEDMLNQQFRNSMSDVQKLFTNVYQGHYKVYFKAICF